MKEDNLKKLFIFITLFPNVTSSPLSSSLLSNDTAGKDKIPWKYASEGKYKLKCAGGTNETNMNHEIERREVDYEGVEIIDEEKCNSKSLQNIMLQNMAGQTAKEAKTKIMRAAEAILGGYFNVICASGDFSYTTTTSLYCLQPLGNINCYAFLTGNSRSRLE
ncbi:hypothetical protein LOAG_05426 [Loa loa]|uniref:Ground-like domain-containing protein n=1 Tax=Loa loa TaxID=7209 RepID=A0A1I7VS53_LOALO|nr:hypothetical protein LOAG_05426 [Loa loa]EFO23060.1 hypothetical protein LOAG_05426 [Loa loa]